MKYYSHITSVFSEANTSMRDQSMLESNASVLGGSFLNETMMTDMSSSSAVFNRSLSLKLAKGQKKQDGTQSSNLTSDMLKANILALTEDMQLSKARALELREQQIEDMKVLEEKQSERKSSSLRRIPSWKDLANANVNKTVKAES